MDRRLEIRAFNSQLSALSFQLSIFIMCLKDERNWEDFSKEFTFIYVDCRTEVQNDPQAIIVIATMGKLSFSELFKDFVVRYGLEIHVNSI